MIGWRQTLTTFAFCFFARKKIAKWKTGLIKASFPLIAKPNSQARCENFYPITIFETLAASLRVGYCDEWKRGLSQHCTSIPTSSALPLTTEKKLSPVRAWNCVSCQLSCHSWSLLCFGGVSTRNPVSSRSINTLRSYTCVRGPQVFHICAKQVTKFHFSCSHDHIGKITPLSYNELLYILSSVSYCDNIKSHYFAGDTVPYHYQNSYEKILVNLHSKANNSTDIGSPMCEIKHNTSRNTDKDHPMR